MAYGAGLSRLYAEAGQEESREISRYEREIGAAERAAKRDSQRGSLWSTLGSVVGAGVGLFAGGPSGAYKGYQAGKEIGKWGSRITSDYDVEDYLVSTDTGKFGKSQKWDLQDINRQMEAGAEGQFWKDVTDTGTTALSLMMAPDLEGKEWWTKTNGGAPDWLRAMKVGKDTPKEVSETYGNVYS